jgi:hypothetical protein
MEINERTKRTNQRVDTSIIIIISHRETKYTAIIMWRFLDVQNHDKPKSLKNNVHFGLGVTDTISTAK